MNCKPNELAIVVRAVHRASVPLLGKMRVVTTLGAPYKGGATWNYEGERLYDGYGNEVLRLTDAYLRPIRPDAAPVDTDVVAEVVA